MEKKDKFYGIKNPPTQIISFNEMKKMIKKWIRYSMEGAHDQIKDPKVLDKYLGIITPFFRTCFEASL